MDFSEALREMRQGKTARRAEWKEAGKFVGLQMKGEDGETLEACRRHLWIDKPKRVRFFQPVDERNAARWRGLWLPEQVDILADDWEIVNDA